jgi:nucleoside-diphosphate-sugar epimerase
LLTVSHRRACATSPGHEVFLAGGTGAIGRRLVPQLVAAGHEVAATTRSKAKESLLRELGAQPVIMDALDAGAVGAAVAAAEPEVIIHEMTSIDGVPDLKHFDRVFAATNRLRIEGTDHLLAAARASGVRRVILQSYTGWPNERTGGPIKTEDDPLDDNPPANQRESLAAIRHIEKAARETPIETLVLRYANFYGPDVTEAMFDVIRAGKFPIIGDGGGIWSWIHLDDAAAATVAALTRGSGVYNIVDDEPAVVRDMLPAIARIIGAKQPRRVPAWLARPIAGAVGVSMLTEMRGSSNAKAKRELGWEPRWRTWRDGMRHEATAGSNS